VRVVDLPFRERPAIELLGFVEGRAELDHDYAGFGWARLPSVWLVDDEEHRVDDALVLALHSPDDSEPISDDIELEFELEPGREAIEPSGRREPGRSVIVMLSLFLEQWLPKLPKASAIVLVLCNPHRARPALGVPLWLADGDVEAWRDDADRILLRAETWYTLDP
jgi:hypothetical protein